MVVPDATGKATAQGKYGMFSLGARDPVQVPVLPGPEVSWMHGSKPFLAVCRFKGQDQSGWEVPPQRLSLCGLSGMAWVVAVTLSYCH